jgi:hypothetical protein
MLGVPSFSDYHLSAHCALTEISLRHQQTDFGVAL